MLDFDAFFKELKDGVAEIAQKEEVNFIREASSDGAAFLNAVKADVKRWAKQYAEGKLSKEEFEFLVKGKKDLAKMDALTRAGLAAIRVERMRAAMIDLIITTAGKLI